MVQDGYVPSINGFFLSQYFVVTVRMAHEITPTHRRYYKKAYNTNQLNHPAHLQVLHQLVPQSISAEPLGFGSGQAFWA
jgi:hypothetical protein